MRSFVVVVSAASGLSACAGLHLSSTEQDIEPPATVTATPLTDTRISVSWTAVPGALAYFVLDKQSADSTFVFVGTTLDPGTSQVVLGLTPNTSYDFEVITESTDGSISTASTPVSATTFAVAPGAPTNVVATAVSNNEIDLSWTSFPTATAVYVLESQAGGPNNFLTTVLAPGNTFAVTGRVANTMYCYQLVSQLSDGSLSGLSTPPACATTGAGPQPPTGLIATAISDTRILVQWQPEAGAAKYFVRESQSGGPFTVIAVVLASEQSFAAVNLQPSTSYCFTVSTVFPDGTESAQSSLACATTLGAGAGGFQGYWKLDERTGTTAFDSSGFNRHGTITNATFSLADRAQLDDNRSALSFSASPDSAITVPAAPGFDLLGPFTVAFWAKLPAAGDVGFIGVRAAGCGALGWEIAQDASGLHFAGQTQTVAAGTSIPVGVWTHVAVTLDAGEIMHLFVNGVETASGAFTPDNTLQAPLNIGHVAGCAGGAVLMDDVQILNRTLSSTEVSAIGTLPPPPTNLHVTSTTSATLVFAWDPVPGAVRYIVSKGTASGTETFLTHSPADPPTFGDGHLTPSTQYFYNVRSVVGNLFSNASSEFAATTNAPPAAPTNVTAMVVAPDRIQVQWSASPDAAKYLVFMSTAGGPFVVVASVLAPDTSFQAVNLSPATTYSFEVQSEDSVQTDGPRSAPASATTP